MSQTENILILGASFAGLSAAHYFLKHVLPVLSKDSQKKYHVYLIDSSTHWYWRNAAPRALVSSSLMPDSKIFYPIADGFKMYDPASFTFMQGTATSMDPAARTVTVTTAAGEKHTLPYHALIIATGTHAASPILTLQTTHEATQAALHAMNRRLPSARSIVIAGGGPAGVETAGEIGEFLNGTPGWFSSRPAHPKARITLVTSDKRLLPALRPALGKQAEAYLNRVGVEVLYNARMERVEPAGAGSDADKVAGAGDGDGDGETTVHLSNGETLAADVYIPATGVQPNTSFVPPELLNEKRYVQTNPTTLRVDAAGPRVYALGDVGSYARGGVMDVYDAVPVVMTNVKRDLLAAAGSEKGDAAAARGQDRPYKPNLKETQLVPVGRSKGVGAVFGWKLPSLMVWMIKGRDYMTSMAPGIVEGGKWKKESKWALDA